MKTTINQLMREFEAIEVAHDQLNTFFRGDLTRAVNENEIVYPLMCAYHTNASIEKKTDPLTITVVIADRVFNGLENLNDTDSDTLQVCRDVINVMRKSPRWQKIGRVQSVSTPKFFEDSADKVCGHAMQVQFVLFDTESICDLPMSGYDFEGSFQPSCAPVTVTDSNGTTVVEVPSGGAFSCTPITPFEPVTGQNSDNTFSFTADSGENVPLLDIEVTLADGVQEFPSNVDINLSNYAPLSLLPMGIYRPDNTSGSFILPWFSATGNVTTGLSTIEKISGAGWNGSAAALIDHAGDFTLSFNMRLITGSDCMFGLSFQKSTSSESECDFCWYRSGTIALVYEKNSNKTGSTPITDTSLYEISRIGNQINYYIDSVLKRSVTVTAICPMNLDCSIFNGCIIENITVEIP